jgi:single-stranded-DNA-specific exonuclease
MAKAWRFCPHDESLVKQLCRDLRVAPLTAQVLVARELQSVSEAQEFLDAKLIDLHEPDLLPGVVEAAERIVSAIQSKRPITIYGDYDVDGVTATSLLWHCLKLAGADVDYHIPCRFNDGYGLNCDAIRQFAENGTGRLVVSVDCGIGSVREAALARELGLELIITDHHHIGEELPAAACLVHPRLPGGSYPFGDLCGVGVAFKLAWAICQRLGDGKKAAPRMKEFLMSAVGLTAIGTIADVVPLLGENRVLVRYGLKSLAEKGSLGLKALMHVAKIEQGRPLDAEDISFGIAPRINAAGRLEQGRLAVELLTTENPERALQLAAYCDELNKNRRTAELRIFKQAKALVEEHPEWKADAALVVASSGWHAGVIGIVASRVAEHFEKPALLLSISADCTQAGGSGRSYAGFDLHAGLEACSEWLISFGGHRAAAGVRVSLDKLDGFREAFCRYAQEHHQPSEREFEMRIDAEVRLADVTHPAVKELDRLGPFGQGNPRPVFAATHVELASPPKTMGEGDRHLDLRIRQHNITMRAIAFGRAEWAEEIAAVNGPISIGFTAAINHFKGRESVELKLEDWQPEANRL